MESTAPSSETKNSLFRQRIFAPLFWTQALGAFNDNFFKNAIIVLFTFGGVQSTIPTEKLIPLAGAVFILPFFLFSGISGAASDKYEKSAILKGTKVLEIFVMALGAIGFFLKNDVVLLSVLFFMGLQSTIFGPAKYSILPQLIPSSRLVEANGLVEFGTFLSILLGTMAGVIVTWNGGPTMVSAGVLIVAVIGYLASRGIPAVAVNAPDLVLPRDPISPTITILKQTARQRGVFNSALGISWFWFFGATYLSLFPIFTKEILRADANVATLLLATFSFGIGLGSMVCSKLSRGMLELGLVPIGTIGMSIFTADLALMHIPFAETAAHGAIGTAELLADPVGRRILFDLSMTAAFGGLFIVPLYTFIQERAEPEFRSRVVAGNNILNALFMVVASLMLIALQSAGLGEQQIFLLLAGLNLAVALYIYTVIPEFVLRFTAFLLSNVMYRVKVTGRENFPSSGAALLVCNHVSFVDWLIVGGAVPRPGRFVMYWKIAELPLVKFLLRDAKVIPIAPAKENPEMLEKAMARISEELAAGEVVCIFPEGKLTADGKIDTFKSGVERILATNPVPVIPMALGGMWGSWFSRERGRAITKSPSRFWSRVTLTVGPAVRPEQASAEHLESLVREMWSAGRP